jgi:hypothetical protein
MARTHTFKGSASAGYGYAAFIEDGQLVITVDWGRDGRVLYRGPYHGSTYYVQQLWKEAPKLYNSIVQYYAAQAKKEEEMKVKISGVPAKEETITKQFEDSRDSRGNGYSGYIENNQLVLEYDDPRSGGEYFRGSYDQAWHLGHIERLKHDDPRLYNAIEKYYSKHDPDVSVREKTSSPAGVLWQVKLYMDNGRELNCQVRGLNEACVIKKLFPKIPEVLTLQGWNANVCAVDSKKIMAVEFMEG